MALIEAMTRQMTWKWRNRWNGLRWMGVRLALRLAKLLAVKGCDHGDRVQHFVDGFLPLTGHR